MLRSSLYAIRFYSHAFQKVRVRAVCGRCWYANTEQRRRANDLA